jgi:hypothetical protein
MTSHAIGRAKERYGLTLDRPALRAIEARLAAGEGMILRKNQDGSTVQVIRVQEQLVTVVLAKDGHIKTFPPKEAALRRRRGSDDPRGR